MSKQINILLFLIAIVSLSQAANLIRLAQAPVEVIGFWRLLFASCIMLSLAWKQQKKPWPKNIPLKAKTATVLSGCFFFAHLWSYFYSAQNTTIANSMIIFSANPLFTAVFGAFIFKEKLPGRLVFAYILAFSGLYLLLAQRIRFDELSNLGNWSALVSAAFYSGYILSGNRARQDLPNLSYTWLVYLIAAILFFLTGTIRHISWTTYPQITWFAILGTVIFPTLLGHALITYLLKFININWLSCGKLTEPAMSAFIAYLLFSEIPSKETYLAFALTGAAILILFVPWKNNFK